MRPILGLMIMGEHNEGIDNQCAFGHSGGRGITMEVLGGVVIARNFGHVKNGAAPPNPPHHHKRKKNHPLPRNNVGSGDPILLTLPLPCGAKGVHG